MENFNKEMITQKTNLSFSIEKDFYPVMHKLTKSLSDDGYVKSFREIKKMDRIEFGKDAFEMTDIIEKSDINYSNFLMHIPFINEGVLKCYYFNDSVYVYFKVKDVNASEKTISLFMDIYKYNNGNYMKFVDLNCTLRHDANDGSCFIVYEDAKYGIDYIHEKYEKRNKIDDLKLSKEELMTYGLFRGLHINKMEEILDGTANADKELMEIISVFNGCILAVNTYIDREKGEKKVKKTYKSKNKNKSVVIDCNSTDITQVEKINYIIIHGIMVKKSKENSQIKTNSSGRIINRQTQVWGVVGHFRHYKSGKTIYIQPYRKGPGRENLEIVINEQTVYKVIK